MKRFILTSMILIFGFLLTACGGNEPLTATIISPNHGDTFSTQTVTVTAEDAGDDVNYTWDFGDGTAQQSTTELSLSHTYRVVGEYTISLKTTKGDSESESASISISIVNAPPTAALSAVPISGPAPLQVVFSSDGSSDPEGPITEEYDFGDGDRGGPGATVRHTYQDPGTYTATLIVRDAGGQEATSTVIITVGEPPRARLWEVLMVAMPDGSFIFDPPVVKINPGDTIEWVNKNDTHSTTTYSPDNGFLIRGVPVRGTTWNSGIVQKADDRWALTFPMSTPHGSYAYFCDPHEFTGQVGIVVVGEFSELDEAFVNSLEGLAREHMLDNIELARQL